MEKVNRDFVSIDILIFKKHYIFYPSRLLICFALSICLQVLKDLRSFLLAS